MTDFLLNPARLAFQIPDILGGLLLAGNRGEARLSGNGDCILVDGFSGVVAVADGAERSPQASRDFLTRLASKLSGTGRDAAKAKHAGTGREPGPGRSERLRKAVEEILDGFPYEERTTFLCLLAAEDGSNFYLSGGDSLLFHLDPAASKILFSNRSNMGFAGRSKGIMDSGTIRTKPGDLFLLASDGLWDLLNGSRKDLIRFVFEELRAGPVHTFPDRLIRSRHPACRDGQDRPYDDLGILLVSPARLPRVKARVLLGGTEKKVEVHYRQLCRQDALADRYAPLPRQHRDLCILPDQLL